MLLICLWVAICSRYKDRKIYQTNTNIQFIYWDLDVVIWLRMGKSGIKLNIFVTVASWTPYNFRSPSKFLRSSNWHCTWNVQKFGSQLGYCLTISTFDRLKGGNYYKHVKKRIILESSRELANRLFMQKYFDVKIFLFRVFLFSNSIIMGKL